MLIANCTLSYAQQNKGSKLDLVTSKDLPSLLKNAKTDSLLKLERLTALYFHEQLNEYRVKRKRDKLYWDDTLWMAARNHAVWMLKNDKISHTQSTSSKSFSGKSYKDRIAFVVNRKVSYGATGENALYNSNSGKTKSIDAWAQEMARICFNQWKNSKDHHDNMLQKLFQVHAMAIVVDASGQVFAVDLFTSKPAEYEGSYELK